MIIRRCPTHQRFVLKPKSTCPWCGIRYQEAHHLSMVASAYRKVGYDRRFTGVVVLCGLVEA